MSCSMILIFTIILHAMHAQLIRNWNLGIDNLKLHKLLFIVTLLRV